MELQGKKVLVVGLGMSGVAAARFLAGRGARVSVNDAKDEQALMSRLAELEGFPFEYHLGGHPEEAFLDADMIVLSPGVPAVLEPLHKAADKGIPVLAEVELASRFLRDRIVGITGSNGKSTTTALAAHLLRAAGLDAVACGNIGSPLIDLVETTSPERTLVVELSSFQLETIDKFRPSIATILNITPDHLDRYDDMEAYKRAKLRLLFNQLPGDRVVIDADEAHAGEIVSASLGEPFYFSSLQRLDAGVCLDGGRIAVVRRGKAVPILPPEEMGIRGPHNLCNAMAAASIATLCGAEPEAIAEGLRSFKPLEHRLEPAGEIDGVLFVNDSKATNVDAAAVALQSFDAPIVAIMGGRDKAGDFTTLRLLVERNVKQLILIGEAGPKIGASLEGAAPALSCDSMEAAIRAGLEAAEAGEVVLLVPACTSFDMYDNFMRRGEDFKRIVGRLAVEHG